MTNYEKETLKNIERAAKGGLKSISKAFKQEYDPMLSSSIDSFNHILNHLKSIEYEDNKR